MRKLLFMAATLAIFGLPAVALADSTTGTSLTVTGTPTPGQAITASIVVSGKHLVYGPPPPYSVPGGTIQISVNGSIVLAVQATAGLNSNVIDAGCVRWDAVGNCTLVKWISDNTSFSAPITLPQGASQFTISAKYTGDDDSHPSESQAVTLQPVYPGVSAAVDLLLND